MSVDRSCRYYASLDYVRSKRLAQHELSNRVPYSFRCASRALIHLATWQDRPLFSMFKLSSLSFDERFAMLVDAEHLSRDNRRIKTLLKDAELRIGEACLEGVDSSAQRGLDKGMLRQMQSCAWVEQHLNVLITGMTGTGKSYLACALGQTACRRGLRVIYRRVPRLFDELALAKADGSYIKVMRKLGRAQVLILDDLGLGNPTQAQRHDLLEVLEDRYAACATVVTSQLPREKWHEWIGEPTVADAILDRLVHNAYKINLDGASRRKPKT